MDIWKEEKGRREGEIGEVAPKGERDVPMGVRQKEQGCAAERL